MGSIAVERQGLELDRTLYDLYQLDNEDGIIPDMALVLPTGGRDLSNAMPSPVKYAYQAPRAPKMPIDIIARACMSTGPQSMSFMSGPMKVNFFNPDKHKNEPAGDAEFRIHQLDALATYAQLPEHQRPEIDFVYSPDELDNDDGKPLAFLTPLDCFEDLPHACDPDAHYELLSKRCLAVSDLPSPKTNLVDCNLTHDEVDDDQKVDAEAQRMIDHVVEAVPPFVVKLPQALGGQGVYVVENAQEQQSLVKELLPEAKNMIKAIRSDNEHLHPACLIVQDKMPGTAVALSFFITKAGRAVFTGCCEQDIDAKGHWAGAVINYEAQGALEKNYAETMQLIASFVRKQGYWGPMGADIMTDHDGKQYVIDLNVRVAASYVLGFLKTHLSVRRNLHHAMLLYPLPLKSTRDDFEKRFRDELDAGKLTIVGWCHGRAGPWGIIKYSMTSVVAAAETPEALRELTDRVNTRRIST